jgi:hypothetical protein
MMKCTKAKEDSDALARSRQQKRRKQLSSVQSDNPWRVVHEKRLGRGGDGIVTLVTFANGVKVCVKHYHLTGGPQTRQNALAVCTAMRGVEGFRQLHPQRGKVEFGVFNSRRLVFRYCKRALASQDQLSTEEVVTLVMQLSRTLARLHAEGWIHGDIKPENLAVHNGQYYFIDCDRATKLKIGSTTYIKKGGTHIYNAPELFFPAGDPRKEQRVADRALDWYALGKTIGCLMTELNLYDYKNATEARAVLLLNMRATADSTSKDKTKLHALVKDLLKMDPIRRGSFETVAAKFPDPMHVSIG